MKCKCSIHKFLFCCCSLRCLCCRCLLLLLLFFFLPIYLFKYSVWLSYKFNVLGEYTIASVCLFVGFVFRFVLFNLLRFCRILFGLILVFLFVQFFLFISYACACPRVCVCLKVVDRGSLENFFLSNAKTCLQLWYSPIATYALHIYYIWAINLTFYRSTGGCSISL